MVTDQDVAKKRRRIASLTILAGALMLLFSPTEAEASGSCSVCSGSVCCVWASDEGGDGCVGPVICCWGGSSGSPIPRCDADQ